MAHTLIFPCFPSIPNFTGTISAAVHRGSFLYLQVTFLLICGCRKKNMESKYGAMLSTLTKMSRSAIASVCHLYITGVAAVQKKKKKTGYAVWM